MKTIGKTRFLALLGAVVLAGSLSGCIIQSNSRRQPPTTDPNLCARVQLSWAINELGTNIPLTCEEVPADTVSLLLSGTQYDFPCNAYAGVTTTVPIGTYSARVGLFDRGQSVSETSTMNITLPDCGTWDLNGNAPVVFDVN